MHLVHTYIAYRVSNICSVYRSGLLYVPDRHSYLCVRYAHQSANAVSRRGGVYSYIAKRTVIVPHPSTNTRRHLHRIMILHVLFTGQILHKQLLNLLKSTVYTITNVARCSARQLRAPPQHSPYAPAAPTRLAGQGRTHRHHLPLPPYSLSESLAAKAQPQ